MKKKDNTAAWILVIGFLFIIWGGTQGWFSGVSFTKTETNYVNTLDTNLLNNPPEGDSVCSLSLTPRTICKDDFVTGNLIGKPNTNCYIFANDGVWKLILEGRTNNEGVWTDSERINVVGDFQFVGICDNDNNGVYSAEDCITNIASLRVNNCDEPDTTPDTPQVGDVVGGGSGSGSFTGDGSSGPIAQFSPIGFSPGGDCYLGAKITLDWDYESEGSCWGVQGQQGVNWVFVDSSLTEKWSVVDNSPNSHYVELCPLYWDGSTPWKLWAFPLQDLPECTIDYNYNIEIFVCECD